MNTRFGLGQKTLAWISGLVVVGFAANLAAQVVDASSAAWGGSVNIVVPQLARCVWSPHGVATRAAVQLTEVVAQIDLVEQVATTTLDVTVHNGTGRVQEVVLLIPVPRDAVVRSFAFEGTAKESTATLLPADEARRIYHAIVAKARDPGLLEFADLATVRSSVFPVPAGGQQKVRLTYESLAHRDGNRVDYVLPRSQILSSSSVPWKIEARIASQAPIATVYSASHPIDVDRRGDGKFTVRVKDGAATDPGAFQLSYLVDAGDVTTSLLAYPDSTGKGGYFLLLAGLPAKLEKKAAAADVTRELIVVLDRSGSMAGEKIEQAKAAAVQVVDSLDDGELFNIIDYSDHIERFAPQPVAKDKATAARAREYIAALRANGGTALHDALVEALRQPHTAGRVPLVLFLTDGLPTVGQTSELAIRAAAEKNNAARRRIFTIGVGNNVNVPLLSTLARESRATETFILPSENVEVKVSAMFRKLRGPVLVEPRLVAAADDPAAGKAFVPVAFNAAASSTRIRDVVPARLPDLFDGDQLVVLGRYEGSQPLDLVLAGQFRGTEKKFRVHLNLDKATTRNAFVPRLWASRKIALLVDEVRQKSLELGLVKSASAAAPASSAATLLANPAMKELVEEIVRLSKEFGVLTEYTAFLAEEGTHLASPPPALASIVGNNPAAERGRQALLCAEDLNRGAVQTRSGAYAVSQGLNNSAQVAQVCANPRNAWLSATMNRVSTGTVQQVADLSFFQRNGRWVDARILDDTAAKPDVTLELGSEPYAKLADTLSAQGRNCLLGMPGEIILRVDGKTILIHAAAMEAGPESPAATTAPSPKSAETNP